MDFSEWIPFYNDIPKEEKKKYEDLFTTNYRNFCYKHDYDHSKDEYNGPCTCYTP